MQAGCPCRLLRLPLLWQPGFALKTVIFLTGSCTGPCWRTSWDLHRGNFHLANMLVAALQEKYFGIAWAPIQFRNRMAGERVRKDIFIRKKQHEAIQAVEDSNSALAMRCDL